MEEVRDKIGKIIAIGGGEIGRPGFAVETTKIDQEIIRLSGKKQPRLLFIPTASSDSADYIKTVEKHFGKRLGCRVSSLLLNSAMLNKAQIKKTVFDADIIYVGGGNTLKMMKIWRKSGLDDIIKMAYQNGKILSGLSAGAICWFKYGHSDSHKFSDRQAPFIRVSGLGLFPLLFCPHYDREKARHKSLKNIMKKTGGIGIALDNCAALEIIGSHYRLLRSRSGANGYRCYWCRGQYRREIIKPDKFWRPLAEILKK